MWSLQTMTEAASEPRDRFLDDPEPIVRLEGAASDGRTLCRECGEAIVDENLDHAEGCSLEGTPADELTHPVSWLNSAHVALDGDSVTVGISVGDPRGFHGMTIRRGEDGTLYLSTPSPDDSLLHTGLDRVREGYYRLDDPDPATQEERKAEERARNRATELADALSDMRELAVLARQKLGGTVTEGEVSPELEREALEAATELLERIYGPKWWQEVGGRL